MKKQFLILFLCGLICLKSVNSFAQQRGTLVYSFTQLDSVSKLTPHTQLYKLYFNNNKSIQLPIPSNQKIVPEKVAVSDHVIQERIVIYAKYKTPFLLKDYEKDKIFKTDVVGFKQYYLTDTLQKMEWLITSDHRKIANYNCTKALTTFRGRKYEAWYTDDIPINIGPWKFDGLPGVIVKVNDLEKIFNFELVTINLKENFDDEIISIPKDYDGVKPITYLEFIERHKKMILLDETLDRAATTSTMSSKTSSPPLMEKY